MAGKNDFFWFTCSSMGTQVWYATRVIHNILHILHLFSALAICVIPVIRCESLIFIRVIPVIRCES